MWCNMLFSKQMISIDYDYLYSTYEKKEYTAKAFVVMYMYMCMY